MKRIPPKAGQESVWDYPRPPKVESTSKHIKIEINKILLANSNQSYRILETSHPPVYYIPPADLKMEFLNPKMGKSSFCEFKGMAIYWDIVVNDRTVQNAAWSYPNPNHAFLVIKDYLAFYPSKVDACYVNDEKVQAQEGDFYGGWITKEIVGPFKGGPGTWGW